MEAYLDNSATTRVLDSVKEICVRTMCSDYGNPSSMHRKGVEAEQYIRQTKRVIASTLKADEKELVFTSGGTESNNMALIGGALANRRRGNHIITTCIEHPSVSQPLNYLESQGFRVTYLPVDHFGLVDLDALKDALCEDTILVSVMYVNNEIGAVEPIEEIARMVKGYRSDILFHVDAIQAFGKYRITPSRQGIYLLSVSGHKIHGPKGIGFLYIRDKVKVTPVVYGGGQQRGLRSGTENVPGIAALGIAVQECYKDLPGHVEEMYRLKELFSRGVLDLPGTRVNGPEGREGAPHIVSVSFDGVKSEVLLHALEDKGIYVSAGSACSSNHPSVSATLKAIGVRRNLLDATLRFSFGLLTNEEEIRYTIQALGELLPVLRKYRRG